MWWRGSPFAKKHSIKVQFANGSPNLFTFQTTPETAGMRPNAEWFCQLSQAPQDPLQRICETSIFRDELIAALSTDMGEFQRGDFVNKAIGLTELVAVERRCSEYLTALRQREHGIQRSYDSLRGRILVRLNSGCKRSARCCSNIHDARPHSAADPIAFRNSGTRHDDSHQID